MGRIITIVVGTRGADAADAREVPPMPWAADAGFLASGTDPGGQTSIGVAFALVVVAALLVRAGWRR